MTDRILPNNPANSDNFRLVSSRSAHDSTGGYTWRKARGLLTIADLCRAFKAVRYTPHGCRCPLPDSLIRCARTQDGARP